MTTTPDLDAILTSYRATRATWESACREQDQAAERLLRRYVAALFREHPGLNALALAAYQDYDSSQLWTHTYVRNNGLSDDAWGLAGFPGECPTNELERDVIKELERTLERFSESLRRLRGGDTWCIAFWRDPSVEPDGVASGEREHPGFD
ncbi:MAG: hypothetical protein AB7N76_13720 [Planctomycetota bacterium]